jgi:AcrR family transcriptional regulator
MARDNELREKTRLAAKEIARQAVQEAMRAATEAHGTKAAKAAKAEAKAAKSASKAEQLKRTAERLDRLAAHLEALDVWTRAEPGSRKPRYSRDELAHAAVRIADAEGFDALSMRRLAAELGAGTMTLYHYIRTKDELLTLVVDTVMAEVLVDEADLQRPDWRDSVVSIARMTKAMIERHPWVLDIMGDPGLGPNSVRHFDQTIAAVSRFSDDFVEGLDVVLAVDEYVFGHCAHQRMNFTQPDEPSSDAETQAYVRGLLATGGYPSISRLVDRYGFDGVWERIATHGRDEDRFERGLRRLLAGFEAERADGPADPEGRRARRRR